MNNGPVHKDTKEYSEGTIAQQPKNLSGRHRALMRKLLAGKTLADSAEELGYTLGRASVVVNCPLFKDEMQRMQEAINTGVVQVESEKAHYDGGVKAQMEDEALNSLQKLIDLRDRGNSERVQQVSAIEILDRGGYGKTDKVEAKIMLDASEGLTAALGIAIKEMRSGDTKSGKNRVTGEAS